MKVFDLNGIEYKWKMKGRVINSDTRPRSKLHVKARKLIQEAFPTMQLLEEVPFDTGFRRTLYLDFYLSLKRVAIEVHGSQHYTFSAHFHKTRSRFIRSLANDRMKREWCDMNNIGLVVLKFDEQDSWHIQLNPSSE